MRPAQLPLPVGAENQKRCRLRGLDQMAEEEQGRLGRPVEVVEDEEDGMATRGGGQNGGDRLEEPVPVAFGVATRCKWDRGPRHLRDEPGQLRPLPRSG